MKAQHAKGKLLEPERWDATDQLFSGAGHMPLLAFFGDSRGSRNEDKLRKREERAIKEGWGPEPGGKRSAEMQRQGMGKPPGHEAFLEREARRKKRQQEPPAVPAWRGYPAAAEWCAAAPAAAGQPWTWEDDPWWAAWNPAPWSRGRSSRDEDEWWG